MSLRAPRLIGAGFRVEGLGKRGGSDWRSLGDKTEPDGTGVCSTMPKWFDGLPEKQSGERLSGSVGLRCYPRGRP